jgi:hypothetical protein
MTHKKLTDAQRQQYFEEGYTMVPDLIPPEDLEPLRNEIASLIDEAAVRLRVAGKITDLHADEPFESRLTRLLTDHPELQSDFFRAIEGKGGGGHVGQAMFQTLTHPRLLDAIEDLVGPEITASSVYRIRPKVPGLNRGIVPWHQDSGYFAAHCDDRLIVTVWIPLVDATIENGCLQVLPGAHDRGVVPHRTGGNAGFLVIEDDDLPASPSGALPVPVPRGGALLMTNLMPHCSTPNNTDVVRWSIDLRYQSADVPSNLHIPEEEITADNPEIQIACYAPEGDFMVRSAVHPEAEATYDDFIRRRSAFERVAIPGPNRGWKPATV